MPSANYQVKLNLTSTDVRLIAAYGGVLPGGAQIGYVSNYVGEHGNFLGANTPKQLVYVDFDGGVATEYAEYYNPSITVQPFRTQDLDSHLVGLESTIIEGSATVTGIMDNVLSIYENTPASNPAGRLTVRRVDPTNPADWAAYQAAPNGLWFTTVDPSVKGLDPATDFTTVFVGRSDDRALGGGLLGIASSIDTNNMDKGNNALVFTQNVAGYSLAGSADARLNEYSVYLANLISHELGHTLGLNHHPTDYTYYELMADDPDNNPLTVDDSNRRSSLMAYAPVDVEINHLSQLGTDDLAEFVIGQVDHVSQLLWWLT